MNVADTKPCFAISSVSDNMPKAAVAHLQEDQSWCAQLVPNSFCPQQPPQLCQHKRLGSVVSWAQGQQGLCADVLPAAHGLNVPDTSLWLFV